jgi:hypothetical protein
VNNLTKVKRLPVDVHAALKAICTTGKGRCWHCDAKLPRARRAIREGWDVQRIDDYPVASIILVCPACLSGQAVEHPEHVAGPGTITATEDQRDEIPAPVALAPGET